MNKNTSCDASVLINFLKIDRIDLLEKCSHSFFITDHVEEEISTCYPNQKSCLESGLKNNSLQKICVDSFEEIALFADLNRSGQLGAGECAAIAVASHRGYYLAIDDNQAIKKTIGLLEPHFVLRTQDLICLMIQEQILEIEAADQLIEMWATQHRFKLNIRSFSELFNPSRS